MPENEDGLTGDIFNMKPHGTVFSGGQGYGIAEHAKDSIGPVVLSQQDNAEITRKIQAPPFAVQQGQHPAQQAGQQGVQPGAGTPARNQRPSPPILLQSAICRARGGMVLEA
jgi:hypothetical protein